jgi:hypothetical protein
MQHHCRCTYVVQLGDVATSIMDLNVQLGNVATLWLDFCSTQLY